MESSSVASASSEAGSTRSQEIEELERFIDSYVLEYQVQGILEDKPDGDGDGDDDKVPCSVSPWTEEYTDQLDGSCPSKGRRSPKEYLQNGTREDPICDVLGTDIWTTGTNDSMSGATWDLQPEKLRFTSFYRRPYRKYHFPHIDREGLGKGKTDSSGGICLTDMEKALPTWQDYHQMPHEAEIAQTKKLFRRRRNDRRKQQRAQGGNKPQQQQQQQHQQQPQSHQNQTEHQQNTRHCRDQRDQQRQYQGNHGPPFSGRQGHHGYNQNRRWHQNQRHTQNDRELYRNAKETETGKEDRQFSENGAEPQRNEEVANHQSQQLILESETKLRNSVLDGVGDKAKCILLPSSKDRLRRRLKEKYPCIILHRDQEEVTVEPANPQKSNMGKLIEILNSMRNNSSDVDSKLATFMEEAQNSANSEEMLSEIVKTIYQKAATDRSFASTAARLCDKMALFMVEGTKFRSLLLNMLQKDFSMRDKLQQSDVERWLGFITFLCEVFGIMRSSKGEPFRVLVGPIYTCLRELLNSEDMKEDAVLCCSMELQSTGKLLEEQLPEMMVELLAIVRDKMLCPTESALTRSLLLEVIELHANSWNPLTPTIAQYYNKTIQKLTA
ncbi:CBP80/20-dependent translation initiation factor [Protopterus annectens]|uniref:CBP80/20-dependent translation initiation factor n=1 Tax=Protopterus annectens TaxID=7888 RepID=UPI001CFA6465|nr:CBP80/20-dependent translation initiation factor [Protopterus annectens]